MGVVLEFLGNVDVIEWMDCGGCWIMLGFVDCYMYFVYGGNCVYEFELCLKGVSYEEIVCVGGGIVLMVMVICKVSEVEFVVSVLLWFDVLIGEGVIIVEIKLGYGFDVEMEMW